MTTRIVTVYRLQDETRVTNQQSASLRHCNDRPSGEGPRRPG